MNSNVIITIIIVTYNSEKYICQCLDSIYRGNVDLTLEIIVVDNNSSDSTINIIKKKYPSIILIVNSKNEGFARANNQAMEIAKGKYLFLLNPDTIISHNALERFRAFLDKRTNADVWCIGGQLIDENGAPSKYLIIISCSD